MRLLTMANCLALLLAALDPVGGQPAVAVDRAVAYDRVVAVIAQRQSADERVAVPAARSILLTHGAPTPRVVVLLHGLTDSPMQFAPLADLLYGDGNNVFVPRLPQHGLRGGSARALAALSSAALRGFADSVADAAAGLGDSVVVVGLSLGGTVAAWLAQQHEVWRAVLIAPALEPGRIPEALDRAVVGLLDRLPDMTRPSPSDRARPDREPGFSTHAAAETFELGGAVLREASRTAPRTKRVALLLNADDRTVRESAAITLARDWEQRGVAVLLFELPDSLGLPHNVVDPTSGRALGNVMPDLLRQLSYGERPSPLVRLIPLP
jgi:pimeloyl-ACP methyl ester carboxylesterase